MKTFIKSTLEAVNLNIDALRTTIKEMRLADEDTHIETRTLNDLKDKYSTLRSLNSLVDATEIIKCTGDVFKHCEKCADISNYTRITPDRKYTVMHLDSALSAIDFSGEYETVALAREVFAETIREMSEVLGYYEVAISTLEKSEIYTNVGKDMKDEVANFNETISFAKSKKYINNFINSNKEILGITTSVHMPAPMVKSMLCQSIRNLAKTAVEKEKREGTVAQTVKNKAGVIYTIAFLKKGEFYSKLQNHIALAIKGKELQPENENCVTIRKQGK